MDKNNCFSIQLYFKQKKRRQKIKMGTLDYYYIFSVLFLAVFIWSIILIIKSPYSKQAKALWIFVCLLMHFLGSILFYFYRKKRNLIVESIFIILCLLIFYWVLYEVIRIASKPSDIKVDQEAFYFLWFGSFFVTLMIISFFKFRKTLSFWF